MCKEVVKCLCVKSRNCNCLQVSSDDGRIWTWSPSDSRLRVARRSCVEILNKRDLSEVESPARTGQTRHPRWDALTDVSKSSAITGRLLAPPSPSVPRLLFPSLIVGDVRARLMSLRLRAFWKKMRFKPAIVQMWSFCQQETQDYCDAANTKPHFQQLAEPSWLVSFQ